MTPSRESAAQIDGFTESLSPEFFHGRGRGRTALATNDDGFVTVFLQCIETFFQFVVRDVAGIDNVSGRELLVVANVEDQSPLVV